MTKRKQKLYDLWALRFIEIGVPFPVITQTFADPQIGPRLVKNNYLVVVYHHGDHLEFRMYPTKKCT